MLKLSIKYLLSKKLQSFFVVSGIIFSTATFVCINGFFQGFQDFLMENLINNQPHIKITPRDSTPTLKDLKTRFYKNSSTPIFLNNPKKQDKGDYIHSPDLWYRRFKLDKDVVAFSPQIPSKAKLTRIGSPKDVDLEKVKQTQTIDIGLAKSVGAYLSEIMFLNIGDSLPSMPLKLREISTKGIRYLDDNTIYSNIEDSWELIGGKGKIKTIGVKLKKFHDASRKASHWKAISNERIESWDQINKDLLNIFKIQNATRYLIVFITIIISVFGIFIVLNSNVNNKKKDIGILGALGFTPKQISRIFLNQGILLGLMGGVVGLIFGYLGCLFIEAIPLGETPMGHLNVTFNLWIYVKGFLVSFFTAIITSYYPSRIAFKLKPIEIIRGQTADA